MADQTGADPPLAGVRVLEFGQYIAATSAGQALADLGADVVKVESPAGDPARRLGWKKDDFGPMFVAYNRGKRSVVADLSGEEGRATALRLALSADVVLQNARPGIMQRAGLDAASLRARKPGLIVGSVSGFGADTPYAGRPGFDIAAQAESGMMSLNGSADGPPTRVGFPVVDLMSAGALTNGVLAALVRRGVSGAGATVDVALLEVATQALAQQWAEVALSGQIPERRGNGAGNAAPTGEVVQSSDGAIVVSAFHDSHWAALARALGREAWITDARFLTAATRFANLAELQAELRSACAGKSSEELCELIAGAGVVVGAVRTLGTVREGVHGLPASLCAQVGGTARGIIDVPARAYRIDGLHPAAGRLPGIGEHTQEVLREWPLYAG
ncbi:MAG: CoA transferase [Burkholderiales bacterium]|nr:CoA transferase [Burkholderiales bacterium]